MFKNFYIVVCYKYVSSMYKPTQAFKFTAEKFTIFTHHIVSEVVTKA